jgi:uncharacterized RDD family membrane protein YckC
LGFETGDRCKNCGYDFSLMADVGPQRHEIDLDLRDSNDMATADWLARMDVGLPAKTSTREPERLELAPQLPPAAPVAAEAEMLPPSRDISIRRQPAPARRVAPRHDIGRAPLFTAAGEDSDEPLVRLPSTPRTPLAVRRTPEIPRPRARAVTTSVRRMPPEPTPTLRFEGEQDMAAEPPSIVGPSVSCGWNDPAHPRAERITGEVSNPAARIAAAAIDHVMLGGIDLAVVYFTLRMAGLPMHQWMTLPPLPLITFLLLIKLSYFCAFTAVGGQTIGKMAAHIRVVSADDGRPLDPASALRRTLAGLVSAIPCGLGFLPALLGSDRRALHDRYARTRVIVLKSA